MKSNNVVVIVAVVLAFCLLGYLAFRDNGQGERAHDHAEHSEMSHDNGDHGHDHAEHEGCDEDGQGHIEHEGHDDHGHDHDDHEGHDHG
jgi:hypothetical protein